METNNYDPWWDGKVGIAFTNLEWELIHWELEQLYYIPGFPANEKDQILVDIMNTIHKHVHGGSDDHPA